MIFSARRYWASASLYFPVLVYRSPSPSSVEIKSGCDAPTSASLIASARFKTRSASSNLCCMTYAAPRLFKSSDRSNAIPQVELNSRALEKKSSALSFLRCQKYTIPRLLNIWVTSMSLFGIDSANLSDCFRSRIASSLRPSNA